MLERFAALGWREVLLAACLAYIIYYVVRNFQKKSGKTEGLSFDGKNLNVAEVHARCKELFPIEEVTFQGKVFTRGMYIRLVTNKNRIIDGELIGKNKVDLICIRTETQIIAHQLDKVRGIILMSQEKTNLF